MHLYIKVLCMLDACRVSLCYHQMQSNVRPLHQQCVLDAHRGFPISSLCVLECKFQCGIQVDRGECGHATWKTLRGKTTISCWNREPSMIVNMHGCYFPTIKMGCIQLLLWTLSDPKRPVYEAQQIVVQFL